MNKNRHDGLFQVYQQDYTPNGSDVTVKMLTKTKRKTFLSEYDQVLYD